MLPAGPPATTGWQPVLPRIRRAAKGICRAYASLAQSLASQPRRRLGSPYNSGPPQAGCRAKFTQIPLPQPLTGTRRAVLEGSRFIFTALTYEISYFRFITYRYSFLDCDSSGKCAG